MKFFGINVGISISCHVLLSYSYYSSSSSSLRAPKESDVATFENDGREVIGSQQRVGFAFYKSRVAISVRKVAPQGIP